jgi:hypothetical protein
LKVLFLRVKIYGKRQMIKRASYPWCTHLAYWCIFSALLESFSLKKTYLTVPDKEDRDCWCCRCKYCNGADWVGKGWRGSESRGGAVVTRQGTRVDGDSPHEQNTGPPSKLGFSFLSFLLTRGFD